jgi:hypothetical protein
VMPLTGYVACQLYIPVGCCLITLCFEANRGGMLTGVTAVSRRSPQQAVKSWCGGGLWTGPL